MASKRNAATSDRESIPNTFLVSLSTTKSRRTPGTDNLSTTDLHKMAQRITIEFAQRITIEFAYKLGGKNSALVMETKDKNSCTEILQNFVTSL